jgi:hypothetical protein
VKEHKGAHKKKVQSVVFNENDVYSGAADGVIIQWSKDTLEVTSFLSLLFFPPFLLIFFWMWEILMHTGEIQQVVKKIDTGSSKIQSLKIHNKMIWCCTWEM